ncbi:MAG: glutamate--tRNA ligase [Alphaproteobacteria bacterium]|nr:glutamate--tRNA ligase [Alphaproteobacteria bacterium]
MTVVTRFAPSPTGFLHIGGARTALFNWLYARRHGGLFLLRIEDTDKARSTDAAKAAILDGMAWLALDHDGEVHYQSDFAERHAAVAHALLEEGKAYHCYCTPEELQEMRERAKAEGRPMRYDGRWRDRDPSDAPAGVKPVVRLKAPQVGESVIEDRVQGRVTVANAQLDDMILLRSDGTPTYMLSVVVDDHDMGVTHVIRGDDHLNNAFRQHQLYAACGWDTPAFAHIPLIHGPDGAKLSKRHGALGVEAYREIGYLPEAVCNYLLRLGWSHGDDEIISRDQAVAWFDLAGVGKSPSRFDFAKLENLNGHYMRQADDARLAQLAADAMGLEDAQAIDRIQRGMSGLKERAKTVKDLADSAGIYVSGPTFPLENAKAAKLLSGDGLALVDKAAAALGALTDWTAPEIESAIRAVAEQAGLGLGKVAQPLRAALSGSTVSPSVFEVMAVLGKDDALKRLKAAVDQG